MLWSGLYILKWFTNYLSNRKQCVKLEGGITSDLLDISMGVPQGSILCPFMFVLYINNLIFELQRSLSNVILCADDTILYVHVADENAVDACKKNQEALDILFEWCGLNRLSINAGKTKHNYVGT